MRRQFNVKKREDFLSWIDAHCVWFAFIQQLATGAKHFVRQPGSQPILIGGYGERAYGVGPYGKEYLVIDLGEEPDDGLPSEDEADDFPPYQRWQTAAGFLEGVVRFWRDFFRTYLPHPDLPASRHYSM